MFNLLSLFAHGTGQHIGPFHFEDVLPPPALLALSGMLFGLLAFGALLYFKGCRWMRKTAVYIWKEWLTSLDPKKIGIMYIIVSILMFLRGLADALLMRGHQALASGDSSGLLTSEHFQQVFTAHGTIMIF